MQSSRLNKKHKTIQWGYNLHAPESSSTATNRLNSEIGCHNKSMIFSGRTPPAESEDQAQA